jgi:hypothetical protein
MKRFIQKLFIGCCCVLALGVILTVIGLLQGGTIAYAIYPTERKVYTAKDTENAGGNYREEVVAVEDFDSLQIDVDSADVEIKQGDGYQVSYCLQKKEEPSIVVKDGSLQVKSVSDSSFSIYFFPLSMGNFGWGNAGERIVVTLPAEKTLESADIQSDYGDITVQQVNIEKLELESGYGDISMQKVNIENLELKANSADAVFSDAILGDYHLTCDYGDVTFKNSQCKSGEIKADSGDVVLQNFLGQSLSVKDDYGDVTLADCELDRLDVSCDDGDVDIALNGNLKDYDFDVSVSAGDFKLNGKEQGTPYEINEGKDKKIIISDSYGDVSLKVE